MWIDSLKMFRRYAINSKAGHSLIGRLFNSPHWAVYGAYGTSIIGAKLGRMLSPIRIPCRRKYTGTTRAGGSKRPSVFSLKRKHNGQTTASATLVY